MAIQAAILIVSATRIGAYAAWTASVRSEFATALLYILPLAAITLSASLIIFGERLRPVLARILNPIVAPLSGTPRTRCRRPPGRAATGPAADRQNFVLMRRPISRRSGARAITPD